MRNPKRFYIAQIVKKRVVKLANSLLDKFYKGLLSLNLKDLGKMNDIFVCEKTRGFMRGYKIISLLLLLTGLGLAVSGCGIYNGGFECSPGRGIGCASTSEVLDMIVEKEPDSENPFDSGKNLFIPDSRSCK